MRQFQQQESLLTLAQGLEEYFSVHPGLTRGPALSAEASEFFRCHDVAHIVFGCDTALDDEAVVKLASIFGTTARLGVLKGYRLHESIDIYKQLRILDVLRSIAHAAVIVPRTIYRCLRQHKRWPWDAHQQYLGEPLGELRRQFGIMVAHPAQ